MGQKYLENISLCETGINKTASKDQFLLLLFCFCFFLPLIMLLGSEQSHDLSIIRIRRITRRSRCVPVNFTACIKFTMAGNRHACAGAHYGVIIGNRTRAEIRAERLHTCTMPSVSNQMPCWRYV